MRLIENITERVCWSKFMRDLEPSLLSITTFYFLSDNQNVALGKWTWQRWIRWDLGKLGVSLQVIGWDSVYQDSSYSVDSVSGRKGWHKRDFGGATYERGWLYGPGEERVGWGGGPATGPCFGSCHCSSPSALSMFQGDRVPPTGSWAKGRVPGGTWPDCWPVISPTMENFMNAATWVSVGHVDTVLWES